jgi:hypothetical protein
MADVTTKCLEDRFSNLQNERKYGMYLHYLKEPTYEQCLLAVKQDGCAVYYIKKQTPEICLAAVQQNGWALQYIKDLKLKHKLEL